MESIYDPLEFINKIELLSIAIIGSFITLKFLNALYDNLYEPAVDVLIDADKSDKYYFRIGKYYIQIGMVIKEFIKWLLLIVLLMIIYNIFIGRYMKKVEK